MAKFSNKDFDESVGLWIEGLPYFIKSSETIPRTK